MTIDGGRRLNMICVGRGSPTVVFETGLGSNLLHWQKVIDPVSKLTRACFYDRAGYGYSDPQTASSTAENATKDLHSLLAHAKEPRPVVLVGHSLGGLYATLYTYRHPKDVAGLVLIEPAFAQQDKDEDDTQRMKDASGHKTTLAQFRSCAALARTGKLTSEPHEECFAFSPNRTQTERAYLSYQMTRPYRYETMASEIESQYSADGRSDANSLALLANQQTGLAVPVVVLTAAEAVDPKASSEDRAASARLWQSWKAGHDKLAAGLATGRSLVVPATGHFIQLDQPEAVTAAVTQVVLQVRKGRPDR